MWKQNQEESWQGHQPSKDLHIIFFVCVFSPTVPVLERFCGICEKEQYLNDLFAGEPNPLSDVQARFYRQIRQ